MADSSQRRSRSRSPTRRAPKGSGGFRWKDKKSTDRGDDRDDSGRRRHYRDRDRDGDRHRNRERSPRRDRDYGREQRRGSPPPKKLDDSTKRKDEGAKKEKKEKKAKKASAAIGAGQEMIIVHINDRLGTKSAVPCLPTDTIRELKLMIAARIGREPGQIMLRRQGERPFKDPLTLDDYGISNGVQLDLEIDTGD